MFNDDIIVHSDAKRALLAVSHTINKGPPTVSETEDYTFTFSVPERGN